VETWDLKRRAKKLRKGLRKAFPGEWEIEYLAVRIVNLLDKES